jgi:hypothetical protein
MSVFSYTLILFDIPVSEPVCFLLALSILLIPRSCRLAIPLAPFVCRPGFEHGRCCSWEVAVADSICKDSELAVKMNIQLRNFAKPISRLDIYIERRNKQRDTKGYITYQLQQPKNRRPTANNSRLYGRQNSTMTAQTKGSFAIGKSDQQRSWSKFRQEGTQEGS